MTTKKLYPITGITLEGFQVFEKPTYISLDGLTLIFGPNSAGKSSVQDALDLYEKLKEIEVKDRHGAVNNNLRELLKRHWRKIGDDNKRVEKMSISVFHTTECVVHWVVARELNRNEKGNSIEFMLPLKFESRWSFILAHNEDEDNKSFELDNQDELFSFHDEFEFFVDSTFLVSHKRTELQVNLNNPFFQNIEIKVNFSEVAKTYPVETSLVDGYFTISTSVVNFQACGHGVRERQERWLDYYPVTNEDQTLLRAAVAELSLLVGYFLRISNEELDFKSDRVDASRTVPTTKQLTFRLGNLDDTWEEILAAPATIFRTIELREKVNLGDPLRHILPQCDSRYIGLAESLTHEFIHEIKTSHNNYGSKVNRMLSDYLFLERGYQIDFDMRAVISKDVFQAARRGRKLNSNDCGFLVELFLRDGQGRKHSFDDVGSGIGYVLPVLCSVFRGQFSFIQQPELHLHPALQAAMGDVFIAASGEGKQILIETHSEHLLLRILKRIRQTHLQAHVSPELKINADDVCVLYFNPLPDGTTTVKRLRITEDGEFMDRWPRGFFGERDQELLDE